LSTVRTTIRWCSSEDAVQGRTADAERARHGGLVPRVRVVVGEEREHATTRSTLGFPRATPGVGRDDLARRHRASLPGAVVGRWNGDRLTAAPGGKYAALHLHEAILRYIDELVP
jgi:hypothetical protein